MPVQIMSKHNPQSLLILVSLSILLFVANSIFGINRTNISETHMLSVLDSQIVDFLHPVRPAPGLKCDVTILREEHPLILKVLTLPAGTDIDQTASIIQKRLAHAKEQKLSAHDEACFVLGMNQSSDDYILAKRLELMDSFMSLQRACDPRYGTNCAGFTWSSPFKLLQNKV